MDFSFTGRRVLVLARGTNIIIIGTSTAAADVKERLGIGVRLVMMICLMNLGWMISILDSGSCVKQSGRLNPE